MVADLEDVDLGEEMGGQQAGFGVCAGVSHKQECCIAIGELQDDRILILICTGNILRVQAVEIEAADGEDINARDLDIVRFGGKDRVEKMLINGSSGGLTVRDNLGDREGLKDLHQAADMIGVWMGGDHQVDALDTEVIQVLNDAGIRIASVNEDGLVVRNLDENGITLGNVDEVNT
jgi:hypothetical protein